MYRHRAALATAIAIVAGHPSGGAVRSGDRRSRSLTAQIDSIIEAPIKAGKIAGASIAVIKGSDTIAIKGFGSADLELAVPTPPNATYEVGSITKQFTAAAILQLAEQGKLRLDADVTEFFPRFPTHGHRMSVRRLLDHTSGLESFTPLMPWFHTIGFETLPRDTVVTLMGKEPVDFAPGEEEMYSNTGYFLLGLIIEKVSGQTYAQYVAKHLFAEAGMNDSYYCSERTIHERHAHGYDTDSTGLVLKAYTNHTWPFSAGSLCSTAADLAAWNRALHGGAILGPAMYREMTTPTPLNDGATIRYAKGVIVAETQGHRVIRHDGSIYGFRGADRVYPDDSLSVVVLLNTFGPVDPNELALAIANLVLHLPPDRGLPFDGDLAPFGGTYRRAAGTPMAVTLVVSRNQLAMKSSGPEPRPLLYRGADRFESGETSLQFVRRGGRITGVRYDIGYASIYLARQ